MIFEEGRAIPKYTLIVQNFAPAAGIKLYYFDYTRYRGLLVYIEISISLSDLK